MHTYIHVCIHTYVHAYISCIHTQIHIYLRTLIHTCIRAYMQLCGTYRTLFVGIRIFRIFALPMKIGGGSGGPCRVVVELPNSATGGPREDMGHNSTAAMDRVKVIKEIEGGDPVPRLI